MTTTESTSITPANTEPVIRPPLPPFDQQSATLKVRLAEDTWNRQQPERVSLAYTPDSLWRNRSQFLSGRDAIVAFLQRKWQTEKSYRLVKELWASSDNRIAVRFAYEWHDNKGQWYRSYGNENWQFAADGLMELRIASINDLQIDDTERLFHWPQAVRPDDYPGLSELGL